MHGLLEKKTNGAQRNVNFLQKSYCFISLYCIILVCESATLMSIGNFYRKTEKMKFRRTIHCDVLSMQARAFSKFASHRE